MMRWLHSLLHWRCERELARVEAVLAALVPRYVPVVTPPGTVTERVERALKTEAVREPEREVPGASSSWPERVLDWEGGSWKAS